MDNIVSRFECHAHDFYSNLRLADAIASPESLVDYAYKIGLAGIADTTHESLGNAVRLDKLRAKYREIDPNFKVAQGNEIYLTNTRDKNQYYYHHILIALDGVGHKMLRELSSNAWINSYYDRGMERVPTLKSEVEAVVEKYGQGHLHSSQSCLGGEINHNLSLMIQAEEIGDDRTAQECHEKIVKFVLWATDTYGKDNFTLEIAPGRSEEQLAVNHRMPSLAEAFDLDIVIGTDAHWLHGEDRFVHKAFLNAKEGEREVDSFYEYAYLQNEEEIRKNLEGTGLDYEQLCANSMKIYDKCQYYTLARKQRVPEVEVPFYPIETQDEHIFDPEVRPTLDKLMHSDNPQERYWVNYCKDALTEKGLSNDTYLDRLEEEADVQEVIGNKLDTCMFAYPIFLQHYIDLFWECGSTVGAGRGSAGAGLNHWLLGITQLDPIKDNLPYWRYLNKERVELGDEQYQRLLVE